MTGGWNPWRALRERDDVELAWADLAPAHGAWARRGDRAVIVLDAGLDRRARSAALAHELVHDERGLDLTPGAPVLLREVEEARVRAEVARRLVPLDELARFVARLLELGEPVTPRRVADEFDTTIAVAARACGQLAAERR